MPRARLNLHLLVDAGREVDCARELLQRLDRNQLAVLRTLTAELLMSFESASQGQRILVVDRDSLAADPQVVERTLAESK